VNEQDDLTGDLVAEVARSHGVAISRDDPVVALVPLDQIVLRRYLEVTVAPAADAIRDATTAAIRQIEQFAAAQATWLEQVSLKDRAAFLEEHKAPHDSWRAEVEALIEGQNKALRQVVMQTAASLRTRTLAAESRSATTASPRAVAAQKTLGRFIPWDWISAGILLGTGATVALTATAWFQLAGQ